MFDELRHLQEYLIFSRLLSKLTSQAQVPLCFVHRLQAAGDEAQSLDYRQDKAGAQDLDTGLESEVSVQLRWS